MAEEKTFSAKQVATRIGTEAKVLRKFFRDPKSGYDAVGQGGRYDFPESDIPKIKAAFDSWNSGKTKRNRPTNAERILAEKAGLVPGQRKTPEEAPSTPRRKRNEAPPCPLDQDDLSTRLKYSIGERARRHGIATDRTGRWVEAKPLPTVEEVEATVPGMQDARAKAEAEIARKKAEFDAMLAEVLQDEGEDES